MKKLLLILAVALTTTSFAQQDTLTFENKVIHDFEKFNEYRNKGFAYSVIGIGFGYSGSIILSKGNIEEAGYVMLASGLAFGIAGLVNHFRGYSYIGGKRSLTVKGSSIVYEF